MKEKEKESSSSVQKDEINHPHHYTQGKIEAIDVIEDWKLDFHLGNVIKYIARFGYKGFAVKDLEKARWYIDRYITYLKGENPQLWEKESTPVK